MSKLGSVTHQFENVFAAANDIGQKKAAAADQARAAGARNSHEVGQKIGIHSHEYGSDCLNTWNAAGKWCKEQYGVNDVRDISGSQLKAWVEHKVKDGLTERSAQTYLGHLAKLEVGLERFDGQARDWSKELSAAREYAGGNAVRTEHTDRAYSDPRAVAAALETTEHRLAAKIQAEGGARINEVSKITPQQLLGSGQVEVQAKNGQMVTIQIRAETYRELKHYIDVNGNFVIDKDSYRADLRQACETLGEKYSGSHGLRYNCAQERFAEYTKAGMSYDEARRATADDLGHHRAAITNVYIGRR